MANNWHRSKGGLTHRLNKVNLLFTLWIDPCQRGFAVTFLISVHRYVQNVQWPLKFRYIQRQKTTNKVKVKKTYKTHIKTIEIVRIRCFIDVLFHTVKYKSYINVFECPLCKLKIRLLCQFSIAAAVLGQKFCLCIYVPCVPLNPVTRKLYSTVKEDSR